MNTYKRYAFAIQLLSSITIITTTIASIAYWFLPEAYQKLSHSGLLFTCENFDVTQLTLAQKLSGFLISLVPLSLFIYGLLLVIKLMKCFQNNEYFSSNTLALLKRITKIVLIYAISMPLCNAILSVVKSFNNPPGQRVITFAFGSAELTNIMIFCFMFMIMTIFQKGCELKHEQDLTI